MNTRGVVEPVVRLTWLPVPWHMARRCVSTMWRDLLDEYAGEVVWRIDVPGPFPRQSINLEMQAYVVRMWDDRRCPSNQGLFEVARAGTSPLLEWMAGWGHSSPLIRRVVDSVSIEALPEIFDFLADFLRDDDGWTEETTAWLTRLPVNRLLVLALAGTVRRDDLGEWEPYEDDGYF
jgi:hypothetical protein